MRWLFATRGSPSRLPDGPFGPDDTTPWETVWPAEEGLLLTDDHFPAELDWLRTAMQWQGLYAATVGEEVDGLSP